MSDHCEHGEFGYCGICAKNEPTKEDLRADLAAERKAKEEAESKLAGAIHAVQDTQATLKDVESRAEALWARMEALEKALNALLDQIDRGTFIDQHGHDARMLKAVHDGMKLMALAPEPPAPDKENR